MAGRVDVEGDLRLLAGAQVARERAAAVVVRDRLPEGVEPVVGRAQLERRQPALAREPDAASGVPDRDANLHARLRLDARGHFDGAQLGAKVRVRQRRGPTGLPFGRADHVGLALGQHAAAGPHVLRRDDDGARGRRLVHAQPHERRGREPRRRAVPERLHVAGHGGRVRQVHLARRGGERRRQYLRTVVGVVHVPPPRRGGVALELPAEDRALRERQRDEDGERPAAAAPTFEQPRERGRAERDEENGQRREAEHVEIIVRERRGHDRRGESVEEEPPPRVAPRRLQREPRPEQCEGEGREGHERRAGHARDLIPVHVARDEHPPRVEVGREVFDELPSDLRVAALGRDVGQVVEALGERLRVAPVVDVEGHEREPVQQPRRQQRTHARTRRQEQHEPERQQRPEQTPRRIRVRDERERGGDECGVNEPPRLAARGAVRRQQEERDRERVGGDLDDHAAQLEQPRRQQRREHRQQPRRAAPRQARAEQAERERRQHAQRRAQITRGRRARPRHAEDRGQQVDVSRVLIIPERLEVERPLPAVLVAPRLADGVRVVGDRGLVYEEARRVLRRAPRVEGEPRGGEQEPEGGA